MGDDPVLGVAALVQETVGIGGGVAHLAAKVRDVLREEIHADGGIRSLTTQGRKTTAQARDFVGAQHRRKEPEGEQYAAHRGSDVRLWRSDSQHRKRRPGQSHEPNREGHGNPWREIVAVAALRDREDHKACRPTRENPGGRPALWVADEQRKGCGGEWKDIGEVGPGLFGRAHGIPPEDGKEWQLFEGREARAVLHGHELERGEETVARGWIR